MMLYLICLFSIDGVDLILQIDLVLGLDFMNLLLCEFLVCWVVSLCFGFGGQLFDVVFEFLLLLFVVIYCSQGLLVVVCIVEFVSEVVCVMVVVGNFVKLVVVECIDVMFVDVMFVCKVIMIKMNVLMIMKCMMKIVLFVVFVVK